MLGRARDYAAGTDSVDVAFRERVGLPAAPASAVVVVRGEAICRRAQAAWRAQDWPDATRAGARAVDAVHVFAVGAGAERRYVVTAWFLNPRSEFSINFVFTTDFRRLGAYLG
jgi:hypothetical protein